MSIFSIGGPSGIIVAESDLKMTEDDRYFMPGIIHGGEDYIIQAYYWSNNEGPAGDRIGARYLSATEILDWAKEASAASGALDKSKFTNLINERSEEFIILNDGTGDFVTLNEWWAQALPLSHEEVISWAQRQLGREASGRADETIGNTLPQDENKLYFLTYRRENKENHILVQAPGIRAAERYLKYRVPDGRIMFGTREAKPADIKPRIPVVTLTDKEKKDLKKSFLASDIEDLDLTVRTYNCLRRANIDTIQKLVSTTETDIRKIRNMGQKSFDEISYVLAAHGESLSPSPEQETKPKRKPALDDRIRSVAHYAENIAAKEAVQESDKLRKMTLDACYDIPGYTYLPKEDKKKLYDMVKKSISLSLSMGKEPERE